MKLNFREGFRQGFGQAAKVTEAEEMSEIERMRQEALARLSHDLSLERMGKEDELTTARQKKQNTFTTSEREAGEEFRSQQAHDEWVRETASAQVDRASDRSLKEWEIAEKERLQDKSTRTDDRRRWEDRYNKIVDNMDDKYKQVSKNYKVFYDQAEALRADARVSIDDPRFDELEAKMAPLREMMGKIPDGEDALRALGKMSGAPEDFDPGVSSTSDSAEGTAVPPPTDKKSPITGKKDVVADDPTGVKAEKRRRAGARQAKKTMAQTEEKAEEIADKVNGLRGIMKDPEDILKETESKEGGFGQSQLAHNKGTKALANIKKRRRHHFTMKSTLETIGNFHKEAKRFPQAFDSDTISFINSYIDEYNRYNSATIEHIPYQKPQGVDY